MLCLLTVLLASACSVVTADLTNSQVVEMKVVVDHIAIQEWKRSTKLTDLDVFRHELNSMFVEVSELYSSFSQKSIDVKFVIKNLTIGAEYVLYNVNREKGSDGLVEFRTWLAKEKKYEKTDYDLAILLTGYDIVSHETRMLYGYGQIATVCTDWAVGMIEYRGATYKDAFVIAHEIGHILGMFHDGTNDEEGRSCKPSDGYVMSPSTHTESFNHFTFSYCSYLYLYKQLTALPWECLSAGGSADDAVKGLRLGTLVSADETCRRSFGRRSYVYRQHYYYYGDNVCTSLQCYTEDRKVVPVFAPQGMYCGKNKQCIKGKCVKTDEGRGDISDVCPFGDQPSINYEGYTTCDELPLKYCGVMKTECCNRCNMKELGEADMACRINMNNPKAQMYRRAYVGYGPHDICQWLACITGYDNDEGAKWKWTKSPPGLICGHNKKCVGKRCLPTGESIPFVQDGCPYGDQPWSFRDRYSCRQGIASRNYDACTDRYYKGTCCSSCYGK